MPRTWEGISVDQYVADVSVHRREVDSVHRFKTCLYSIREDPSVCRKNRCIIWKLVAALVSRGAKLPDDL